ncbi:cobaltochelatase subunit CobN [uncultured Clostridium sp.]|uniref:cobaltochelatase subunit CobN n=1 Tax=uncultured Clostridium sp. TaxID=59620 RepID=UPI002584B270|nr:cobaltochelatase subunit CobN [uncultured Clostridium sp.]MDU1349753.1 cobaltochelatase subunit CobN [Clostridium argentinense]
MFRLTFIMSGFDSAYKLKEATIFIKKHYKENIDIEFIDSYKIDNSMEEYNTSIEKLRESNMIFIAMHGGVTYFKSLEKIMKKFEGKKKFFIYSGVEDENIVLLKKSGISPKQYETILSYYSIGGNENLKNMILYLASSFGDKKFSYNNPKILSWEGIYYPNKIIKDYTSYIENIKKSEKPVIAILFYSKYFRENNTRHIDNFIEEIENLGGAPLAIYTASAPDLANECRGIKWVIDNILMRDGSPQVDAIINTMAHAQSILGDPGDGTRAVEKSIFEGINVPVLQAMPTYQSLESWENSIKGIDMMALTSSVYDPEFDGQIITVATAYNDIVADEIGERYVFKPIKERINKVCRLALNWAKLRKIKNKDKKVAIIFHNMPPRNDMIGCAFGLDTPHSVYKIINALKEDGIYTEYDFQDGDEIINKIIQGVSNDTRWLTAEKAMEKSVDIISGDTYRQWFSKLSNAVREKMIEDWETPPGDLMVFEDKMPVPGIINGNIFIGVQPQRGYEEKAEEVYHSTDIVPPHQYIAYYKWLKNTFKADVIIHVGTHGTLEWLPGKEIGLSQNCYPDIAIDDIPHLYPYIINVPGEGAQAKRRSYAVILDHLIPSLMQSGTYDEMETLDELLKQYYHGKNGDSGKLIYIQEQIVELVLKNNYHLDLNFSEKDINDNFEIFAEKLHGWIEEIKCSLIKDGLHIFGMVPEGERFENLVFALLRLSNGEAPSLIESICRAKGLDYRDLKDNPYKVNNNNSITNLMILDEVDEIGRNIIRKFHSLDYKLESIKEIIEEYFHTKDNKKTEDIYKTLKFVSEVINPKLKGTVDEIKYIVEGVRGNFVPPGGSGCPTRGRVSILPTGRNFYTIDPAAVPTKAAWKVGKQLGDNIIDRYLKDEGKYPENIVMVIYSGETIKTCGDDIAEALYLMGIKPKWLESTDKVIGLEVIPLEELKRPRIDVTLRITGLFRDTFPNIIELVEEAVNMASSLDEDESENYIKRNILNEIKNLIDSGFSVEQAEEEAGMRIFGCPPGTYGAGVGILINSKNWEDVNDLGDVYTLWGGHAYGKNFHGKKVKEVFSRRLASAEVTVKNESSVEIDMLDSDDFYNYHGGLIAAVKSNSGKSPRAYCGNSSDPARTKIKDVNEETARIIRSRILNPKWFEGLKKHGYKGAQEISAMVDIVFGWDATADVVEDWMYEKISETYLFNEERREWIKNANSWAIHSMTERLLEANQRGMWSAKDETIEKLKEIYLSIEGDIEDHI